MSTATPDAPASTVLDLAGLPEPVIRTLRQLVADLRATPAPSPAPSPAPATRPPLRGRFSQPAPEYTSEMMKRDRLEAWANFPRELPEVEES